MPSCSFHIPVHIVAVLGEPVSETPASLANVLLATSFNIAGDGIDEVPGVAVHLPVQVHLVVGSSGLKCLP